ncbi:MAG: hypothetical protein M3Z18_09420 [Gemmatimonadota bacterium]|nr:hypothetical protein [Gemmatimonadota bacterium]
MTTETWRVLPRRVVSSATVRLAGAMVTEAAGCLSDEHAEATARYSNAQLARRSGKEIPACTRSSTVVWDVASVRCDVRAEDLVMHR